VGGGKALARGGSNLVAGKARRHGNRQNGRVERETERKRPRINCTDKTRADQTDGGNMKRGAVANR